MFQSYIALALHVFACYLSVQLGQQGAEPEAPGGGDRVNQAGAGTVEAADLRSRGV